MRNTLLLPLLLVTLLALPPGARAQNAATPVEVPDSVKAKEHSPTKATIFSACLPGLGQAYNRKYWKIPVIYAGFGVMTYFIVTNTSNYIDYKCAYIESANGLKNGSYAYLVQRYTTDELQSGREYYRRNLEISILLTAVWYALNILDATVDAHLYTFNISDNLSMRVEPALLGTGVSQHPAGGLKLSLKF